MRSEYRKAKTTPFYLAQFTAGKENLESKFAFNLSGKQIRYLAVTPQRKEKKGGKMDILDVPSLTLSTFARAGWCVPAGAFRVGRPLAVERDDLRGGHRLIGLLRTDFFTDWPYSADAERDLSVQEWEGMAPVPLWGERILSAYPFLLPNC
jgi:hypothetical protein